MPSDAAPPCNWRRGLLRLWLVLSVVWALVQAWQGIAHQAAMRESFIASCPYGDHVAFHACATRAVEITSILRAPTIETWAISTVAGILSMPLALGILLAVRGVVQWVWRGFVTP